MTVYFVAKEVCYWEAIRTAMLRKGSVDYNTKGRSVATDDTVGCRKIHTGNIIHRGARSIEANVLDCGNAINEFKPQLHFYIHFRTNTLAKKLYLFIG